MFDILETEGLLNGDGNITILPHGNELLAQLLAAEHNT
jgi:hypothetical protein